VTTFGEIQTRLVQAYKQKGKYVIDLSNDLQLLIKEGFSNEMALVNLALQNNVEIEEIRDSERRGLSREEAVRKFLTDIHKDLKREKEWKSFLSEYQTPSEPIRPSPSYLWYLIPVVLGLLGGLIGYVYVHDDNPQMAKDLFFIGLIPTFIEVFIFVLLVL
jgi:hypothetical protein